MIANPNFHEILKSREEHNEFWVSEDDTALYIEDVEAELEIIPDEPAYLTDEDEEDDYPTEWWDVED